MNDILKNHIKKQNVSYRFIIMKIIIIIIQVHYVNEQKPKQFVKGLK